MRCVGCGATRLVAMFGAVYEPRYSVQRINGGRDCFWEHLDLPLDAARLQLASLDAARERLAALIAEAENGG